MRRPNGMTLLEVLITMVVVAIAVAMLMKLNAESMFRSASVKRLMDAGHAIELAVENQRIWISLDPGKAKTPDSAEVAGNFPPPDSTWDDTDKVNWIIVNCSTYTSYDLNGDALGNVRMLRARALIYPKTGWTPDAEAMDTLEIHTAVSRFF